jgi:hypothetical protein
MAVWNIYGHLVHFVFSWYILCSFGTFCVHLVHFLFIWYILCSFGTFFVHLVHFFRFWYDVPRKSGNPTWAAVFSFLDTNPSEWTHRRTFRAKVNAWIVLYRKDWNCKKTNLSQRQRYDHIFLRFSSSFGEKFLRFFLKTIVMNKILAKIAVFWTKTDIFDEFLAKNFYHNNSSWSFLKTIWGSKK